MKKQAGPIVSSLCLWLGCHIPFCALFLFMPTQLRAEATLSFGVYAADKPTEVVRQFRPILSVLEKTLTVSMGRPVRIRMQVARDYDSGIRDLVRGKVDFARLGPASYLEAKSQAPGVTILAMESRGGKKKFFGIICVAKDSALTNVEDLRGKDFAFGNQHSTIGRYLSQSYLLRHGIKAENLRHYEYLGRHDIVGMAVDRGKFDAGALKESTFRRLQQKGANLREMARFPNVTKPWVARAELPESRIAALRQALLDVTDDAALKAVGTGRLLPGNHTDYWVVWQAVRDNPAFFDGLHAPSRQ